MRKLKIILPHGSKCQPFFHLDLLTQNIKRDLPMGEVVEVDFRPEWLTEVRAGVLLAACETSAKYANLQTSHHPPVKFDPNAVKAALKPAVTSVKEQ